MAERQFTFLSCSTDLLPWVPFASHAGDALVRFSFLVHLASHQPEWGAVAVQEAAHASRAASNGAH